MSGGGRPLGCSTLVVLIAWVELKAYDTISSRATGVVLGCAPQHVLPSIGYHSYNKKIVSYVHSRACVMSVAILGIGVAQLLVSLINTLMVGDLLVIGDV